MKKVRLSALLIPASLLSGLLLWLSWPERGFTPLIFIAFVPLFWVEQLIFNGKIRRSGWRVFGNYYIAMLTWNVLTTWWIWNSTDVGSILALGLNSLFMAAIWQLHYITKKQYGSALGYISIIFYWTAFEYLHLNWDISWPWLTLGNVFATKPEWIQWYEFTGVLGGTVWILMVNILLFLILKNLFNMDLLRRIRRINSYILSLNAIILLAFPILVSIYMYRNYKENGTPVKVALVQPNIDPYNEKFSGNSSEQLVKLLQLASTVVDSSTNYLVGPETALAEGIWEETIRSDKNIQQLEQYRKGFPRLNLILGLSSYKSYGPDEKKSITARKFTDADAYYDAYNSAMQIDINGNIQLYHKSRLVPGVEKMPYPKIFGFLEKYSIQLGGTAGSLGMQNDRTNFISPNGMRVAPAICYESIYGDFMSGYIRKGAELIAIITNDGWWGDTPGYRQHLNYARLRAVEFRKSIVRSANTGISCFINQRGDILQQTSWWKEDALTENLLMNDRITFYGHHGDYIGYISAILGISMLLFIMIRRFLFP